MALARYEADGTLDDEIQFVDVRDLTVRFGATTAVDHVDLAVPAGSVISQTPVGGTQVTTGSAVALVISSGLPQVATPNVVGLTQAAATTAIVNAQLAVGTVTTASSTTVTLKPAS